MSKDMIEIISAIGVMLLGIASTVISIVTVINNKRISKREKVIDLHNVWHGVNDINPTNLIASDIVNAVNALSLTATLWNHDIVDKGIIWQSYWKVFEQLYDTLHGISDKVPGKDVKCNEALTEDIQSAYNEMKNPKWKELSIKNLKRKW